MIFGCSEHLFTEVIGRFIFVIRILFKSWLTQTVCTSWLIDICVFATPESLKFNAERSDKISVSWNFRYSLHEAQFGIPCFQAMLCQYMSACKTTLKYELWFG